MNQSIDKAIVRMNKELGRILSNASGNPGFESTRAEVARIRKALNLPIGAATSLTDSQRAAFGDSYNRGIQSPERVFTMADYRRESQE